MTGGGQGCKGRDNFATKKSCKKKKLFPDRILAEAKVVRHQEIQRQKMCARPNFQKGYAKIVCAAKLSKKVPNVCGGSSSGENACPAT